MLARYGGEEFILLLPETGLNNAEEVAEKLRREISELAFDIDQSLTCSFGVTEFHHNEPVDTLIKRVDDCLYAAKNGGRNRVVAE